MRHSDGKTDRPIDIILAVDWVFWVNFPEG